MSPQASVAPDSLFIPEYRYSDWIPALANVGEFGGLGLFKDVDVVVCHALLSNQDFLAAINHEISSLQAKSCLNSALIHMFSKFQASDSIECLSSISKSWTWEQKFKHQRSHTISRALETVYYTSLSNLQARNTHICVFPPGVHRMQKSATTFVKQDWAHQHFHH